MPEYAILHKISGLFGLMAGVLCCLGLQLTSVAQGSQGNQQNSGNQGGFAINDMTRSIRVFDETGKSFVNPYHDVTGSPYLSDAWTHAAMRLNNNAIVSDIQVRLDLKSQQWHFLDSGNIERLVPVGLVTEVLLDDSSGSEVKTADFRSGFPPVDSRKTTDFYRVLSTGKVLLLHSMLKKINIDKDEMAGTVQMEFAVYEEYYLFNGGKMWRVKKDKSEVLNQLTDKKEKMQTFIDENHFKLKSIDEVKRVIDYYNSI
jgi:hypothetical protein